jgi:uncharacterized protein (DUF488 family)
MSLQVHTARLRYAGDDRLDITRTGGHRLGVLFAPSLELFREAQRLRRAQHWSREAFDHYARAYRAEMANCARLHPHAWRDLLAQPAATLCCFCENAAACHRTLLARLLAERGARYQGER